MAPAPTPWPTSPLMNQRHHHRPEPGDTGAPEADRGQLRALLLNSLTPGTVRWGHSVDRAVPLADGTVRLAFTHGTVEEFDLVVGADGAWSQVRPALSDAQPAYTGVTFVETHFDDVDRRFPAIAARAGQGAMWAKAGCLSLMAQRNAGDHLRVHIGFRARSTGTRASTWPIPRSCAPICRACPRASTRACAIRCATTTARSSTGPCSSSRSRTPGTAPPGHRPRHRHRPGPRGRPCRRQRPRRGARRGRRPHRECRLRQ